MSALNATSCFLLWGQRQTRPLAGPGPGAFDVSAEAKTPTLDNRGMCHPNVTEKPLQGQQGGPGEGTPQLSFMSIGTETLRTGGDTEDHFL